MLLQGVGKGLLSSSATGFLRGLAQASASLGVDPGPQLCPAAAGSGRWLREAGAGTFPPRQALRCGTAPDPPGSCQPPERGRAEQQLGDPQVRGRHRAMPEPTVPPAATAHPSPSHPATAPASSGGTRAAPPLPSSSQGPHQAPSPGPAQEPRVAEPH